MRGDSADGSEVERIDLPADSGNVDSVCIDACIDFVRDCGIAAGAGDNFGGVGAVEASDFGTSRVVPHLGHGTVALESTLPLRRNFDRHTGHTIPTDSDIRCPL